MSILRVSTQFRAHLVPFVRSVRPVCFVPVLAILISAPVLAPSASAKRDTPATARESALIGALSGAAWGWTSQKVYDTYAEGVHGDTNRKAYKLHDSVLEDRLRDKEKKHLQAVRDSKFKFDGTQSAYDSSFLKSEFAHNNDESMLMIETATSKDYYLFHKDKLWKVYRAFSSEMFDGASFPEFVEALAQRYGAPNACAKSTAAKGTVLSARTRGGCAGDADAAWRAPHVTGRAVDNTSFYGFYSIVLEDPKSSARVFKARASMPTIRETKRSLVDGVANTDSSVDRNEGIADEISGRRRHGAPKPAQPSAQPEREPTVDDMNLD